MGKKNSNRIPSGAQPSKPSITISYNGSILTSHSILSRTEDFVPVLARREYEFSKREEKTRTKNERMNRSSVAHPHESLTGGAPNLSRRFILQIKLSCGREASTMDEIIQLRPRGFRYSTAMQEKNAQTGFIRSVRASCKRTYPSSPVYTIEACDLLVTTAK